MSLSELMMFKHLVSSAYRNGVEWIVDSLVEHSEVYHFVYVLYLYCAEVYLCGQHQWCCQLKWVCLVMLLVAF